MTAAELAEFDALIAKRSTAGTPEAGEGTGAMTPGQKQMAQIVQGTLGSLGTDTILPFMSKLAVGADNMITGGNKQPLTGENIERGIAQEKEENPWSSVATGGVGQVAGMIPALKGMKYIAGAPAMAKSVLASPRVGGVMARLFGAGAAKDIATNQLPDLATGAEEPGSQLLTGPAGAGALEAAGGLLGAGLSRVFDPVNSAVRTYGPKMAEPVLARAKELLGLAESRGIKLTADQAAKQAAQELGDTGAQGAAGQLQAKIAADTAKTGQGFERTAIEGAQREAIDPLKRAASSESDRILNTRAATNEIPLRNRIGIDPAAERLRMEGSRGDFSLPGRADDAVALETTRAELRRRALQASTPAERTALEQQAKSIDDVLSRQAPTRAEALPYANESATLGRLEGAAGNALPPPAPPMAEPGGPMSMLRTMLPTLGGAGGIATGLLSGNPAMAVGSALPMVAQGVNALAKGQANKAVPSVIDMAMNQGDDFLSRLGQPSELVDQASSAIAQPLPAVGGLLGGAIPDIGPALGNLFAPSESPDERATRRGQGRKRRGAALGL